MGCAHRRANKSGRLRTKPLRSEPVDDHQACQDRGEPADVIPRQALPNHRIDKVAAAGGQHDPDPG